jgi:C4-dicarboxylate-specific signal transduction histidine kinase
VTIYLLEIMGLGLILFLVAMLWQESEISPGTAINARKYHITLEESEYISVLKSALERTESRPAVEPQQKTTAK